MHCEKFKIENRNFCCKISPAYSYEILYREGSLKTNSEPTLHEVIKKFITGKSFSH